MYIAIVPDIIHMFQFGLVSAVMRPHIHHPCIHDLDLRLFASLILEVPRHLHIHRRAYAHTHIHTHTCTRYLHTRIQYTSDHNSIAPRFFLNVTLVVNYGSSVSQMSGSNRGTRLRRRTIRRRRWQRP